ncbi:Trp biosynthesis-associated membrane protein [Nonomuraea sp. NPDC004297]
MGAGHAGGVGGAHGRRPEPRADARGAGRTGRGGGGVVAIVRGPGWAGMSARYERDPAQGAQAQVKDDKALWDALDRGDDPTDRR